jgi:DNA-binding FadR family transcriptional regulator
VAGSRTTALRKTAGRRGAAPTTRSSAERSLAPVQRAESMTEQAYRVIEEQIVTLRLKPGEVLSEQMLSATCGIGRTPIREALQRLAREGLITVLPRKGILVSDLNPRTQLLVLEVRRELERLLSRAGAERATAAQRGQLLEIARGMDQAAKTNDDIAFWYMHYREAADLPLCARLHANQARAIAKGDAEGAARGSDKLMDYVETFTRATVAV